MKTIRDYLYIWLVQYHYECERWDVPLYMDHVSIMMCNISYDMILRGDIQ